MRLESGRKERWKDEARNVAGAVSYHVGRKEAEVKEAGKKEGKQTRKTKGKKGTQKRARVEAGRRKGIKATGV
jgi:hypothetical protein